MLPIAAHHARLVTEDSARSALPCAPVRRAARTPTRLAAILRRAADRLDSRQANGWSPIAPVSMGE